MMSEQMINIKLDRCSLDISTRLWIKLKCNGLCGCVIRGENPVANRKKRAAQFPSDFSWETIVLPGGIWRSPQDGGLGWRATSTSWKVPRPREVRDSVLNRLRDFHSWTAPRLPTQKTPSDNAGTWEISDTKPFSFGTGWKAAPTIVHLREVVGVHDLSPLASFMKYATNATCRS